MEQPEILVHLPIPQSILHLAAAGLFRSRANFYLSLRKNTMKALLNEGGIVRFGSVFVHLYLVVFAPEECTDMSKSI